MRKIVADAGGAGAGSVGAGAAGLRGDGDRGAQQRVRDAEAGDQGEGVRSQVTAQGVDLLLEVFGRVWRQEAVLEPPGAVPFDGRQHREVADLLEQGAGGLGAEQLMGEPLEVSPGRREGVVLAAGQRHERVGALLDQGPEPPGEGVDEPVLAELDGG